MTLRFYIDKGKEDSVIPTLLTEMYEVVEKKNLGTRLCWNLFSWVRDQLKCIKVF